MPYFKTPEGRVYQSDRQWFDGCTLLTESEGKKAYRAQFHADMLTYIKPRDTIYCVIRSVSRSGMPRAISLFYVNAEGKLCDITYPAAVVMGERCSEGAIRVNRCGMDMCFHLVYTLGQYLWPNGTPEPHSTRNGSPDTCGGYALKHSTL